MARVTITDKIREELGSLHKSTGVGPQRLLKGKQDRPQGINSTTIYHWINGSTKTAKSEHLEFVLNEWRKQSALVTFTSEDKARLDDEFKRTGYAPSSLLNRLSGVPSDLTSDLLHRLQSKRLSKIPSEAKEFLFDNLRNLPDKTQNAPKPYLGRNAKKS